VDGARHEQELEHEQEEELYVTPPQRRLRTFESAVVAAAAAATAAAAAVDIVVRGCAQQHCRGVLVSAQQIVGVATGEGGVVIGRVLVKAAVQQRREPQAVTSSQNKTVNAARQ
jgi:hypothetical protein